MASRDPGQVSQDRPGIRAGQDPVILLREIVGHVIGDNSPALVARLDAFAAELETDMRGELPPETAPASPLRLTGATSGSRTTTVGEWCEHQPAARTGSRP